MGVDHTCGATVSITYPGIGIGAIRIAGGGDAPRQIPEMDSTTVSGLLGRDPAPAVITVDAFRVASCIHHGRDECVIPLVTP